MGEDAALPDGWLALGGCLFEPGGDLVTGRSPESLAGIVAVLLGQQAWITPAGRVSRDEPVRHVLSEDSKHGNEHDDEQTGARIPAGKPPLGPRAAQAAFACYAALAILLWLFMLAMGHQPGAVAAMHALQG